MWSPTSWQNFPVKQHVEYPDPIKLDNAIETLSKWPPLVTPGEIEHLKNQLALVADGKNFILQGGDCAESFQDCHAQTITNKFKIMLQMSVILLYGLRKPIVRVGRIAGQYAKPRSSDTEAQGKVTLPSYRGDLINQDKFEEQYRIPNPNRMLEGYNHAAMTLNYLRALVNGGFADLHRPERWDLDFVQHAKKPEHYDSIINSISDALGFIQTIGGLKESRLSKIDDFFTSHEALHLPYETALTRSVDDRWYNLSTHFPWIGMRTANLDGGHIEYFRGIENPIAIKVGPSAEANYLCQLVNKLNPHNQKGKLMLITRFGCQSIADKLPTLIKAVQDNGKTVIWSCDPMHGNTRSTQKGGKTRHFDDICQELSLALDIHQENNSHLGGVHLELTGENVTECVGGARGLDEKDLERAFKSLVDPRLNYEQSIEIAFQICKKQGLVNE
jgi:3-deoxy-7-phosphoheptulonate synthase